MYPPRHTQRVRRLAALFVLAFGLAGVFASAAPAAAQDGKPTIAVTGADLNAGTIEVTNYGDAEVDINGLILCNFPAYAPIEGAPVIGPGETITVDSGAAGVGLDPSGGEMGLYTTPDYENPDAMITYVEWGEPGHQRAPVAIAAGVWGDGVAEVTDGVIAASTDNPISPADWAAAAQGDDETEELAQTGSNLTLVLVLVAAVLLVGGAGMRRSARRSVA